MTGPAEAVLALRRVIVAGRDLDLGSKKERTIYTFIPLLFHTSDAIAER